MPRILAIACLCSLSVGAVVQESTSVSPLFDLTAPERSPFPSDRFTVADASQNTGLRINLPMPRDCAANASECEDRAVLNQLDGFNMQPRVSVPFSGEIDPSSVSQRNFFLVRVPVEANAPRIGINYIVWDPATHELSGRPDASLEQHTTYALVITTGIRDTRGQPIVVSNEFRRYRDASNPDAYQRRVIDASKPALAPGAELAAISVFTTQSFSHIVQRMHEIVSRGAAPTLNFGIGPEGAPAVFAVDEIDTLTNNLQQRVNGPLVSQPQPLRGIRDIKGVGTVAFGTFLAPDFTVRKFGHIPPIATRTGTLATTGTLETAFNLWLPAGSAPANGWPVAIYGHGSFGSKNAAFAHAATLNAQGIALLAFNAVGRGYGERSSTTIKLTSGATMTFAAPGLGYDTNGDGQIENWEPHRAERPYAILNTSGAIAEGAAQTFALVRGIQAGVDVNGDGAFDLDRSRIYYVGQSLGAMWGMAAFAFEPAIRAAVFTVPAGTLSYNTAWSPQTRQDIGAMLERRTPSLLNDGLKTIDGVAVTAPFFAENLPLRNQPPLINRVPGAIAIQRVLDTMAWAAQMSSTVAYAPLLRSARPFFLQFARSDQSSINPMSTEIVRAGDFADRVFYYRHDRNPAAAATPNPHAFLSTLGQPEMQKIALDAQKQLALFFASDGATIPPPSPPELWERATSASLPDDFFYLPRPK